MNGRNGVALAGFLGAVLVVLGGVTLAKGGFYIGKHEGDTLHLLQIVMRMADGDWPHLDFMTPIGVLATTPIAVFVKAGFGVGHAILLAQILVAAVFFPAIWWVARSRFHGGWSYLFGAAVMVLILALVHGQADRSVSISMHYNRWAWAAAFLAITTAFLPSQLKNRATVDGIIIGLGLAVMALIKVTYFAAFIIPILVALIGRKMHATLVWTLASGLVVVGLVTLLAGPVYWLAYLRDLLNVAASEIRPQPGLPLASVIGAPAYMGGSLVLLASVILLRQANRMLEGLVLLLLVPGFFYVTFQNFGNDPQWIGLLALFLFALLPEAGVRNGFGWDLRSGLMIAGTAALAFAAPSYINLAYSPFRHLAETAEDFVPVLPGSGVHEDILVDKVRALRVDASVAMDGPGTPFAALTDPESRNDVTEFRGEKLPQCSVEVGLIAWFSTIADDLVAAGLADGKMAFTADILPGFWLYGAFQPLPNGSPWYYGGLPGIGAADYLIVPLCPLATSVRKIVLEEVEAAQLEMTEIRRTELYILYEL